MIRKLKLMFVAVALAFFAGPQAHAGNPAQNYMGAALYYGGVANYYVVVARNLSRDGYTWSWLNAASGYLTYGLQAAQGYNPANTTGYLNASAYYSSAAYARAALPGVKTYSYYGWYYTVYGVIPNLQYFFGAVQLGYRL